MRFDPDEIKNDLGLMDKAWSSFVIKVQKMAECRIDERAASLLRRHGYRRIFGNELKAVLRRCGTLATQRVRSKSFTSSYSQNTPTAKEKPMPIRVL